jgi:hypothetical protein
MRRFFRWLLCGFGRKGPFIDMLALKNPGITKALKLELSRVQGKKARIRLSIVDIDHPMSRLWDFGILTLEDDGGTKHVLVNLDAVTEAE